MSKICITKDQQYRLGSLYVAVHDHDDGDGRGCGEEDSGMSTFGVLSDSCLLRPNLHMSWRVTVFAMVQGGNLNNLMLTARMARVKEKTQEKEDWEGSDSSLCSKSLSGTRREDWQARQSRD
jgi:hypothetical protein